MSEPASVSLTSWAAVFEAAPDATVVVDRDGRIRIANTRALQLFRGDDLVGRLVEDLLPAGLAEVHRAHRASFEADPEPRAMGSTLDLAARRIDGTTFDADVSLGLVDLGDERLVSAAVRDVTAAQDAHRELAVSAFIVEASSDGIFAFDLDASITSWNAAASRLTGRSPDDVVGHHNVGTLGLHNPDVKARLVERVLRGENVDRLRSSLTRTDGQLVPIQLTLAALRDRRGRVIGGTGLVRDISEEVFAQDLLSEIQIRMAEAQRMASIGLWVWDRAADEMQWSEELYEITGVSPLDFDADLDGHVAPIPPPYKSIVRDGMTLAVTERQSFQAEYPVLRPDGEQRWVMSRGDVVTDDSGRVLGLRGVCQDLTDRHRAVEALQEADRLKDEFLAVISHELRTPLTSILGFAGILATTATDDTRRYLEVVSRNAEEMRGMVERLLDYSRVTSGRMQLVIQAKPVRKLLDSLDPLVTQALGDHRYHVEVDGDPVVAVDESAFMRVMVNLLTNAAKFAPPTTTVQLSVTGDGRWVHVAVTDEGAGIPPAEVDAVFDRFHQVRSNQVAAKRGAGVGLSIVKGYTEAMGGSVAVTSTLGVGSTFTVTLPAASA